MLLVIIVTCHIHRVKINSQLFPLTPVPERQHENESGININNKKQYSRQSRPNLRGHRMKKPEEGRINQRPALKR